MNIATLPEVEKHSKARRSALIAEQLREMITCGTLKPGDRLPTEEQLCRHFGVSRTTLRESVQMLRVSGLLEVTPGRGSFVRTPDMATLLKDLSLAGQYTATDAKELNLLRGVIMLEMVRHCCRNARDAAASLNKLVVERQGDASRNEELERLWFKQMADFAGYEMCGLLLNAFLEMEKPVRLERFADPDETLRIMEVQIRVNSCIQDGEEETAARILAGYLGVRHLLRGVGASNPAPTPAAAPLN